MTANEIRKIAEEYEMDFDCIGIRTQEIPFELGEITHNSKAWVDGEETKEELDGICVTKIDSEAVKMHTGERKFGSYCGNHLAIIGGEIDTYGEDDGEVILKNAVVLYIVK